MNFKELIHLIFERLQEPLPGKASHLKLAPYRKSTIEMDFSRSNPKLAGTLLLLYEKKQRIQFVLIQRPNYSGTHGGQISFPGGKNEKGESIKETAIRETFEEIGVPKQKINVLGELSQVYIPPSNFLITPFIGYVDEPPMFIPDYKEVKEIIEIELNELFKEKLIQNKKMRVGKNTAKKMTIEVPYMDLDNHTVWGATGVILSEFKDLIS